MCVCVFILPVYYYDYDDNGVFVVFLNMVKSRVILIDEQREESVIDCFIITLVFCVFDEYLVESIRIL